MKKSTSTKIVLGLLLSLFCFTAQSQQQWYGDPNKNVNDLFRRFDTAGGGNEDCGSSSTNTNPKVSTVIDSKYGKVWKMEKPKGRKRAEFARTSFIPKKDNTYYYGWRWKISSSSDIKNGITVWQWKTDDKGNIKNNKQNYPLNMLYSNDKLNLNAYGPGNNDWRDGSSINNRRTTLWSKTVKKDTWVTLVVKIKLSTDVNKGEVELWFNGDKQKLGNSDTDEYKVGLKNDNKTATHRTFDGGEVYPKWGSYNSASCSYKTFTYYDEMRIGKKLDDVLDALGGESSSSNNNNSGGSGIEGTYYFKNRASGLYMDSEGDKSKSSKVNGKHKWADQHWKVVEVTKGIYNIVGIHGNRGCLDSQGGGQVIWSSVQSSKSKDRLWKLEDAGNGYYRFKNQFDNRGYLAKANNSSTVEYTNWNGKRAQWKLEKVGAAKAATIDATTEIKLFPNPATSSFTIATGNDAQSTMQVFNISGQMVLERVISNITTIQTDTLGAGIYLIRVLNEDGTSFNRKLILK